MKFDNTAVFSSISRDSSPEEESIGNFGSLYVHIRGLGSTTVYVRKLEDKFVLFTGYKTIISKETLKKKNLYRFTANSKLENLILSQWHDLRRNGNNLNLSYMNIWSMSEDDYGVPGCIVNETLGVTNMIFYPRKDILHSIIGYLTVKTVYGEISNITVGINTNSRGEASFFLYDPSFYDPDNKINFSRFRLDLELKTFILRTIQTYYDEGVLNFKEEELLSEAMLLSDLLDEIDSEEVII